MSWQVGATVAFTDLDINFTGTYVFDEILLFFFFFSCIYMFYLFTWAGMCFLDVSQ